MKSIGILLVINCLLLGTYGVYVSKRTTFDRTECPESAEKPRPPNRVDTTQRVELLRSMMQDTNNFPGSQPLDAYLTLISDDHGTSGSEYDARVKYISGFSGSNGYTIVTHNDSALWTDGRYFLQAELQMECFWQLMKMSTAGYPTGPEWLATILPENARVGAYPNYVTVDTWDAYRSALEAKNIQMIPVTEDLVDKVWNQLDSATRPPKPQNPIFPHTIEFTGKTSAEKLVDVRAKMAEAGADCLVLTVLEEVAWLFNLRGSDRTDSLFYGFALVYHDAASKIFINDVDRALSDVTLRAHLHLDANGNCTAGLADRDCVQLLAYTTVEEAIRNDGSSMMWLNPSASAAIYDAVGQTRVIEPLEMTPIALMKAIKNEVERENYYNCILRDSAAVVEFMAFLEKEIEDGKVWNEITAATELQRIRSLYQHYRGISFDTISAVGPNGAVIHYRAAPETNKNITKNEMYLLDSGGQYLDGTTDVTRTFHFGTPTDMEREAYTRVLMGAIDLATTIWPEGTYGRDIDARARAPIWQNGWDYNHGTGHGIGYFLSVHEGPGRINIGYVPDQEPLYEGMFFSDEPGYYEDGHFGVRLETLVGVVTANTTYNFGGKKFLAFRPATLVPFEPKMIKGEMLSRDQLEWLNNFHQLCVQQTAAYLSNVRNNQAAVDWIMARTSYISSAVNLAPSAFFLLSTFVALFISVKLY